MPQFILIAVILLLGGSGLAVLYKTRKASADQIVQTAEAKAKQSIDQAAKDTQRILSKANSDAQEIVAKSRASLDEEVKTRRQAVSQIENRVMQKEKHLDQRDQRITEKEDQLNSEIEKAKQLKKKHETLIQSLSEKLEQAAGFSSEEAKQILLSNVEREVRQRAGRMIKDIEDQARKIANRRAKEIVTDAIQRTAIDHVTSATTSVVQLPDDELKGRIIGREGRNIRAFEAMTGVDVIIDDTPGAVILSSFDPIRREIARLALQKLTSDGRIQPAKIEEAVEKSKKEIQEIIREKGERAADEIGLQFHPKIIELLGKLHYRTSYGQNILAHTLEAAHIAGIMAEELKVNVSLAKRGAMLHDIGKAIDFETGGSHDDLGKEICEKSLENSKMILVNNIKEAMELINEYAPEHFIVMCENEDYVIDHTINAGSVFLGDYTPESAGDYASGTNHTLPTNGFAKAYSGVSLDSFLKKITFQKISKKGLQNIGPVIETMAKAEHLTAHKNAVTLRLKSLE